MALRNDIAKSSEKVKKTTRFCRKKFTIIAVIISVVHLNHIQENPDSEIRMDFLVKMYA